MACSRIVKAMCLVLIAVSLVAPLAEAEISCNTVGTSMAPCLGYLQDTSPTVPDGCCDGIKSLYGLAKTTQDRQSVCFCLKSLAGSSKDIDYGKAGGLPGKCGVSIPYKIDPSTDCSKVQ